MKTLYLSRLRASLLVLLLAAFVAAQDATSPPLAYQQAGVEHVFKVVVEPSSSAGSGTLVKTRSGLGVLVDRDGSALIPAELLVVGVRTVAGRTEELYAGAEQVRILCVLPGGERSEARFLGADPRTRLAAIKLSAVREGLEPMMVDGSVRVMPDRFAYVMLPGGKRLKATLPGSEAVGVDAWTSKFIPLVEVRLQEPAVGLSGAPVFNSRNQFVGILRAPKTLVPGGSTETESSVWFALPPSLVQRVAEGLTRPPYLVRHRWVGIQCDNAVARPGAVVVSTTLGGPGQVAGLMPGDVIIEADGMPVRSSADFAAAVFAQPIGATITVTVLRGGTTIKLRVRVAAEPVATR